VQGFAKTRTQFVARKFLPFTALFHHCRNTDLCRFKGVETFVACPATTATTYRQAIFRQPSLGHLGIKGAAERTFHLA
jgi:hypothetical protein